MCADDGHPYAAIYAMACALVGEEAAQDAQGLRDVYPGEWAELQAYAQALGVPLPG